MELNRFSVTNNIEDDLNAQNNNLTIIEKSLAGLLNKNVAGGSDVTLTDEEAANSQLVFSGALTGNINVIVPIAPKIYHVQNLTSGSYTLTLKTGAGSGVVIQQADLPDHPRIKRVMVDGINVVWADGSQVVEDNWHESSPASGHYEILASGKKYCQAELVASYTAITRCAVTWAYPVAFIRKPCVQISVNTDGSDTATVSYDLVPQLDSVDTISVRGSVRKVTGGTNFEPGNTCPIFMTAEGY